MTSVVGLFRLHGRDPVANMLATKSHCIASTQAGIDQNIEPYPLPRTDRPARLIGGDVFVCPGRKPFGRSASADYRLQQLDQP